MLHNSFNIYYYIFDNTLSILIIDTDRRKGIVEDKFTFNRKLVIASMKSKSSWYNLGPGIDRAFSILNKILEIGYI